ncbi:proline dehydrogenase family protein [Tenacibaculum finnmarkense]|uniref:proline dehydrogenase family protein n=1 Tax=Tenacibaculum finnmarkense TaxID=2781243 RepID=UPI000C668FFA|nr:proline dehydrogenase family protein [Tenacibaculum finnmarkense]MBE7661372.1 proline dehydrogenase [Tenacibaculum finnmarkense genomovar finnmarkense]MCD8440842.1 proline dehydrogenase family protein [Tenacibaculum finnmarkense genomovar ulcerans]MCG8252988.1 proline dehydrogenase family protein [Tenacibaculum finnmarkense genomovar finnmarkense]MCG8721754.1 proline dehydrogenase [Tenacibaculum finnmarkense]MCG8816471.1 proline dehydrogenase [Tenacibaculum finnmarkense]
MTLFNNTETAFKLKSDSELERAYFLFKMIQNQPMVRIGTAVTNFALKAHLPVEGLIRSTVFDHFCGGVTEDDCLPNIEKMHQKGNVHSILDYSVEGKEDEAQFDNALKMTLKTIDFAEEKKSIPYAVFKPTGFGRFALYQKLTENQAHTAKEKAEWETVVARFHTVCKAAVKKDVPLLIDAEESWMQDAADDLIEELMETYNKDKAIVFNTLQMYRHDRMDYLRGLHQRAHQKGYHIGMKVVRGAYMEKERERAEEKGYESPICKDKEATDENYNEAVRFMMEHKNMAIFAGTHNEESSYLLMNLAKEYSINATDKRMWFGQLYGMSDHISFNLAKEGYNVAKYVPFGPVRDVMPYLIRRAEENTSVAGQTSRELNLIKIERKRRKL